MEGRRGGVSDGGGERRDVFFFTQLCLSGRSSSETENSRTFGLRTARVRADATRDAARARAYRVPDVRHDSNPRGTRVDAANRGTDTSRSRGGSFVTRCARGRSATESHRTVRGTGVGTAGATHLGPVTLILGREGELILPVALLLLLRGRLHHPEERKGAGGQREVRADATTTRGEKGAERFLPIGNALLRGIALLGVSLRWHLLIALGWHLLVALGRVALLGVALGGHPVSLGRHVIRHCLISPFFALFASPLLILVRDAVLQTRAPFAGLSALCVCVSGVYPDVYRCGRS